MFIKNSWTWIIPHILIFSSKTCSYVRNMYLTFSKKMWAKCTLNFFPNTFLKSIGRTFPHVHGREFATVMCARRAAELWRTQYIMWGMFIVHGGRVCGRCSWRRIGHCDVCKKDYRNMSKIYSLKYLENIHRGDPYLFSENFAISTKISKDPSLCFFKDWSVN